MVEVNEALVRKVADLARLALTDDEVKLYTEQMKKTLGYVDNLTKVDVTGIKPMYHPQENAETPMREDVVHAFPPSANGKPKIIEHAPETLYEGFKVPPIL